VERTCDRVGIIREGVLVAVEDVASLKAKALRRLEIRFAAPPPLAAFAGLPGVRDLRIESSSLHSQVAGSLDAMIKAAARFEVLDVISTEPSLEEIFLTYYA
jgi:ABC-2 type transport system ATP-binding protein